MIFCMVSHCEIILYSMLLKIVCKNSNWFALFLCLFSNGHRFYFFFSKIEHLWLKCKNLVPSCKNVAKRVSLHSDMKMKNFSTETKGAWHKSIPQIQFFARPCTPNILEVLLLKGPWSWEWRVNLEETNLN